MKLELKHIAPYLPYGLKCLYQSGNISDISFDYLSDFGCDYFKPILRPLSDLFTLLNDHNNYDTLIEQIAVFTDSDIAEEFIKHLERFKGDLNNASWSCAPWAIMSQMFELHFDVFGLIPKGLAIDINTI